jgi:hypothetical protein
MRELIDVLLVLGALVAVVILGWAVIVWAAWCLAKAFTRRDEE